MRSHDDTVELKCIPAVTGGSASPRLRSVIGTRRKSNSEKSDCPRLVAAGAFSETGNVMNKLLENILEPAYKPCTGFAGTCASMKWGPSEGHVPRGFYGALGDVSDVRLVMVLAEPGPPGNDEVHTGMISAFEYAERCYLEGGGQGHRNVRSIIGRCFPGLPLRQAMCKVWDYRVGSVFRQVCLGQD